METKEKAQQLVDKFYNLQSSIAWTTNDELKRQASIFNEELGEDVEIYWDKLAKQTAVIAVDNIINAMPFDYDFTEKFIEYWQQVKQEIINVLNNK
jgi:hypothetical protein